MGPDIALMEAPECWVRDGILFRIAGHDTPVDRAATTAVMTLRTANEAGGNTMRASPVTSSTDATKAPRRISWTMKV